ncbi:hypothetical protein [Kineococcus sp. SYSU DK006]|uniref:hypothetical protein n=1 Tax=Kineococcus sp. SYSU DK006 TaxID=3383127 RepID=UPI003D7E10E9
MAAAERSPRPHQLDFEDLRTALIGVIDLAIERFGARLDVQKVASYNDHYWHLPVDTAYALDDDPGLYVDAGQSSDDLDELAEMIDQPHEQVLRHSVEHLVGLLNLVAFLADPRPGRRRPLGTTSAPSPAPPQPERPEGAEAPNG